MKDGMMEEGANVLAFHFFVKVQDYTDRYPSNLYLQSVLYLLLDVQIQGFVTPRTELQYILKSAGIVA